MIKQPSGEFNSTSLSRVFSQTVARYTPLTSVASTTLSQPSTLSSQSSTPSSGPASSTMPVGAAVSGAVGGVVLLIIITFTVLRVCSRRRRNSRGNEWEKAELSGHGVTSPAVRQPNTLQSYEVSGDSQGPRYELNGNFHGVKAASEPVLPRKKGVGRFALPSN